MKKTMTFLLSSMMLAAALSSCGSSETTTPTAAAGAGTESATSGAVTQQVATVKEADGKITMGGSTSVEEIVSAMMQLYMEENGDIALTYDGSGSSAGVAGVLADTMDVGLASRELKDSEMAEGAQAVVFAYDGIAVVVNTANTVTDLSSEDLAKIYTKEITDWSEVGGEAGPIVVVSRDAASGTRGAFEEILGITDETVSDSEQSATGAVITNVASTPGAIGYVSLSAVEDQVTALSVDGVSPSEETVKDTSYPMQRPFNFVLNENITDEEAEAFIAWATSDAVAELVSAKGCVAPN